MYLIYALIDPRNYEVRYIGLTRTGSSRFMQHLSKEGKNHRKNGWIQELEDIGEMVVFEVIDKASSLEQARQKEAFWIHIYQKRTLPLFNRDIPKSTLLDVTPQTPASLQLFSESGELRKFMDFPSSTSLEYVFVEMLQERIRFWRGHFHMGGCAVHKSIDMASYHFSISSNPAYVYSIREWAKQAFQSRVIIGYRFRLTGGEWATFGDAEAIHQCEDVDMEWIEMSSKQGTEKWGFPTYVPAYDELGNLLYYQGRHAARHLNDISFP